MPAQKYGQENGFVDSNGTAGLASPAMNQAPTLALGSLASVGLGTRADTQASLTAFESLMGGPAQGILGFADDATPQDSLARVQADAPEFAAMERPVNWAIPLAWESVSMADVAAGKYDATFTAMAETIAEHQAEDINPLLYVRLGWEANNEYPWKISSGPDNAFDQRLADDYVDAFQHVATLFRSVDDRFRIEWNQNYSKADANGVFYDLNEIYPGDEYVDVVGVDAYNVERFSGQDDPVTAWDYKADAPFGLNWFSDFAAAHGKPLALTEWGIDSDDFGHYVDQLQEFARTNNVIYANYWNADARTNGNDTLTDGSKPATAAAIADAFGPQGNSELIPGKQSGLIVEAGTDANGNALVGTASAQIWAVASDPDAGDRVTFDTTGWNAIDTTHFQKNGVYGSAALDTETGIITYKLDNSRDATNALADEDSVTDDFSITVRDTAGASATQTARFVIEGTDDAMDYRVAGNGAFHFDNVETPALLEDALSGRVGTDAFVFDSAPRTANADATPGFDPGTDRFDFGRDVSAGASVGEFAAPAFATGRTAAGTNQHDINDDTSDAFFYDSDGAGGADPFQFASLALHVRSDDFLIA